MAAATVDVDDAVIEVADTFVALMRSFARAKAKFMTMAADDVEWSAQILLRYLASDGPMRAGALADCMHSDPSTVSRQVAALVKDGFIERQADPADGRASILVLTPKADAVLDAHGQRRREHFAAMLADWSEADLARFAALLQRFTDDFDRTCSTLITERTAVAQRSAEGN